MPKLLIVDDSKVSRMMIRAIVQAHQPQWEVLEAANGVDGIAAAEGARPDFVTIDMNMPGINGFDAAEKIRQATPTARIALLTANVQDATRERAKALSIGFLKKPITEQSIQQALAYFAAP